MVKKDTIDKIVNRNLPEKGSLSDLIYFARKDDMSITKLIGDYITLGKRYNNPELYNKCRDNYMKGRYEK